MQRKIKYRRWILLTAAILSCVRLFCTLPGCAEEEQKHIIIRWELVDAQIPVTQQYHWNAETLCYEYLDGATADLSGDPYASIHITVDNQSGDSIQYQISFTPAEHITVREDTASAKTGTLLHTQTAAFQSEIHVTQIQPEALSRMSETIRLGTYCVSLHPLTAEPEALAAAEMPPEEEAPEEELPPEEQPPEEHVQPPEQTAP